MTAKSAKKKSPQSEPTVLGQGLFVLLLLPCMVFICTWFFDGKSEEARYMIDLSRVSLSVPEGMAGADQIRAELERLTEDEQPVNILDSDLTSVVNQMFKSSPYVRTVKRMKREFPGRLAVDLEFAQPVAALHVDERYILVDQYGEVLPLEIDFDDLELPILTVHPSDDVKLEGGEYKFDWLLAAVKQGVQVLKDLAAHSKNSVFEEVYFSAIDISNHGGRLDKRKTEISLVTDRSWFDAKTNEQRATVLAWGRSTTHPLALVEISVAKKLKHLNNVLDSRAMGLADLQSVDLRFDKVYYREK